jgi:hypothetical protein
MSWRTRKAIVKDLRSRRDVTPQAIAWIKEYIDRKDDDNKINVTSYSEFGTIGSVGVRKAIATAFECGPWEPLLARAVQYRLFGDRFCFYWHYRFRKLFPNHPNPLRMVNWKGMTEAMAYCFLLGWIDQARHQGYLTYEALNRGYQLVLSYEEEHRRAHAFMLRIFADWQGDLRHDWPENLCDEPIYEAILGSVDEVPHP